jgi:hypothetical protein
MKLSEIREAYEELSGSASKLSRQLAFAGIGMIWIFRVSTGEQTTIPTALLWPAILLISSLGIDIIQYLLQSLTWYIYYHYKKSKGIKEDISVDEPEFLNYFPWILFFAKISVMSMAYIMLFSYLYSLLFPCT